MLKYLALTFGLFSIGMLNAWATNAEPLTYLPNMQAPLPTNISTNSNSTKVLPLINLNTNGVLSLRNAILIALHNNNNITTSLNTRDVQRYDLLTAQEQFEPQFQINGSASYDENELASFGAGDTSSSNTTTKQANIGPEMNWQLPLGTQISAQGGYNPSYQTGSNQNRSDTTTWTVTLTQPLLKNFGVAVNEVGLHNAEDQQVIDDITLDQTVSSTVTTIITDYYTVVQDKLSLDIDKETLQQNKEQLYIDQQKYAAGRIPRSDVVQAHLNVTTAQQSLQEAEQTLLTAKAQLLDDMGLPGNTRFKVDDKLDVIKVNPDLHQSETIALKNNPTYQTDILEFKQNQRSLLTAENANRWELDLKVQRSRTRANTNYAPPTGEPNSNNVVNDSQVSLDLTIPLNQVSLDKTSATAATNFENAEITLATSKRTLLTTVNTDLEAIRTDWENILVAEETYNLSQKNYEAAKIKASYGKLDTFTLSQQQQQLISDANSLVSAKISYIEAVAQFEQELGILLKSWHIEVQQPHDKPA